jgi:hypothetical protein
MIGDQEIMMQNTVNAPLPLMLVLAFFGGDATAAEGDTDHPLVTRYQGSTIDSKKFDEFAEYRLVTGRDGRGDLTGETLKGRLTRIVYKNPEGAPRSRSTPTIARR